MFAEDAPQLHPLDDAVEQWQRADVIRAELQAIGLGLFAWDDCSFGTAWCGRRAIGAGILLGHCGSPQGWPTKNGGSVPRGPRRLMDRQGGKNLQRFFFLSYD